MEEDEKKDYKLHLHKQLDNLVEIGISVYDLEIVNKQAIRSNYILKGKIKEKIEDYEKMIEGTFKDNTWNGQNRRDNCYEIIKVLENLLEEK